MKVTCSGAHVMHRINAHACRATVIDLACLVTAGKRTPTILSAAVGVMCSGRAVTARSTSQPASTAAESMLRCMADVACATAAATAATLSARLHSAQRSRRVRSTASGDSQRRPSSTMSSAAVLRDPAASSTPVAAVTAPAPATAPPVSPAAAQAAAPPAAPAAGPAAAPGAACDRDDHTACRNARSGSNAAAYSRSDGVAFPSVVAASAPVCSARSRAAAWGAG